MHTDKKEEEHIGVGLIVFNSKGEILMGKRLNVYGAGLYGLPGGHVELQESIREAATRELLEETGLVAEKLAYCGVVREVQESAYNFIHFGFVVTMWTGELVNKEPNKNAGWEWMNKNNIPENMLPGHQGILSLFLNSPTENVEEII